jgi:hypothetical protein
LNQKTVGCYRNGSFLITDAGLLLLQNALEADAGAIEVVEVVEAPKAKTRTEKEKAVDLVEVVGPVVEAVEPPVEHDLMANLDAALAG